MCFKSENSWLPGLARKDLMSHISHSDRCCCTQLRFKRWGVERRVN